MYGTSPLLFPPLLQMLLATATFLFAPAGADAGSAAAFVACMGLLQGLYTVRVGGNGDTPGH
eukprot:989807-Pelagomonas_calceolata.AAC.2